jgi:amidase
MRRFAAAIFEKGRLDMFQRSTRAGALALSLCIAAITASAATAPASDGGLPYASITELQKQMHSGSLTSYALTQDFIERIARFDKAGPSVNSVIELNPDALSLARAVDGQHATAKDRLHGIPVLLKDNIDTGDHMMTTAGSLALVGPPASQDATVVAKLRKAGAVILGKTNLSEWADFRSTHPTSGWSGRGGLTLNPHVLDRNPCGSSAGSGAAVAAGFTTVAIGSETDGSIVCPASANGVVGIKPTLGLVSRTGIIPLAHSQDTAGPIARTVTDAAIVLSAIAGSDPSDPATADADKHATDYTKFLNADGLRGKRIGVVRQLGGLEPNADRSIDQAVALLKAQGAIVIDPVEIPHIKETGDLELTVLSYEFKHDINAYLATRKGLGVKSLADLIEFNKREAAREMPWFDQELFIQSQDKGPLTDKAYLDALEKSKRLAGPEGIDAALAANHLDALLAPMWGPAFVNDLVLGDHVLSGDPTVGGASAPAAIAGYPSITVPAGFVHDLPIGILFFGAKWSEPTLISIAYGYEQHSNAYRAPKFLNTVDGHPVAPATP